MRQWFAYVARDTTRHRAVFYEALHDYRRNSQIVHSRHLRVFWIAADFDADSEDARELVANHIRAETAEDILPNVLFGRLSASRVRPTILGSGMQGLELAVLHSIAMDGFTNFAVLSKKLDASKTVLRDRVQRLQMSGLLIQPRTIIQMYHVGSAGRAFLRLCSQISKLGTAGYSLSLESIEILRMLGIEPDLAILEENEYATAISGGSPGEMFSALLGKIGAADNWGTDWTRTQFRQISYEYDPSLWLLL
jgi:DNA-binding Lrp family transcriptional regulator